MSNYKQKYKYYNEDNDHSASGFFVNQMEVVPLTPSKDETNQLKQRQQQQRRLKNKASGWSNSMALFSSFSEPNSNSNDYHDHDNDNANGNFNDKVADVNFDPSTSTSALASSQRRSTSSSSTSSPPLPNLSESSCRPTFASRSYTYNNSSDNCNNYYNNDDNDNNENRMYNSTFRETTINRTAVQHTTKPMMYSQHQRYQTSQPYQPNYRPPPSLSTGMSINTAQSPSSRNIPNPWLPQVESLTTPSSVASSTTASTFVFGQRRPSLRSEISRLDSVSSSPMHQSILPHLSHTNTGTMLGASSEEDPSSDEDDNDEETVADAGIEVSLQHSASSGQHQIGRAHV